MIRRIVLAGGALVVAASLSSCTTFSRSNAAAEANGEELTPSELGDLTGGSTSGDTARATLTTWLTVAVLGGDVADVKDAADLQQRRSDAIDALSAPYMDEAQAKYELGLDGSPLVCLGAIPLADGTDPAVVLGELQAGATLAATAAKYSSNPSLAQSGGLIQDQNGTNCLDPAGFNPDLITAIKDAGATPGTPVSTTFNGANVIVLMRAFDDLTQTEKASFVLDKVGADVRERLDATEIYVNPRFGRWDPDSVAVVPLGPG